MHFDNDNFYPNKIRFDFWPYLDPYAIVYGFWSNFHPNAMHFDF